MGLIFFPPRIRSLSLSLEKKTKGQRGRHRRQKKKGSWWLFFPKLVGFHKTMEERREYLFLSRGAGAGAGAA